MTKVSETTFPLDSNRVHSIGQGAYPNYSRWEEGQQKTDPAGFSKFVAGKGPISSSEENSFEKTELQLADSGEYFKENYQHVKIHEGNMDDTPSELMDNPMTPSECSLESEVEALAEKTIEQNHERLEKISNDFIKLNAAQVENAIVINEIIRGASTSITNHDESVYIDDKKNEYRIVSKSFLTPFEMICMDDKGCWYRQLVNKEGKIVLIPVVNARKNDNEHDSPLDAHLDYAAEKASWYENQIEKAKEALERDVENHVWSKRPAMRGDEPTTIEQLQQGLEFLTRDIEYLKKYSIQNEHMQELRVDLNDVIELRVKKESSSIKELVENQKILIGKLVENQIEGRKIDRNLDESMIALGNEVAKKTEDLKKEIEASERKTAQMTKNGFDNVWLDIEKLQKKMTWKVNFALGTSIVTLIIIIAYITSQNI